MLRESYPYYLAGTAVAANADLPVTNKYTGDVATRVARADRTVVAGAIGAAQQAFVAMRRMPAFERQAVLGHVVERVTQRQAELAEALALEAGDPRQKISCIEVFGPVATIQPFDEFAEAIRIANDSRYGLQCGLFTQSLLHAFYAYEELDVGGVIVNDIPSFRVDNMPYGGIKHSGQGREGVRYAI